MLEQGLRLIAVGVVLDLLVAVSLSRWFTGFLVGMEAFDLTLYAAAGLLFGQIFGAPPLAWALLRFG